MGFLAHREMMMKHSNTKDVGKTWLYYGCRRKDKDWLFRCQMEVFEKNKVLDRLRVAESRPEDTTAIEPRYVQDWLRRDGQEVVQMMLGSETSRIYVCG